MAKKVFLSLSSIHYGGKSIGRDKAPKALTWFHIGHNPKDEEFIHTGNVTEGCLTMIEHERWDEIYNVLIKARKGDLQSVGVLEVVD